LLDILARIERGQSEITLARRTEPDPRRADDLRLAQHLVEEIPRRRTTGRPDPDVGRVYAAEDREARRREPFAHEPRVLHVERDLRAGLLEASLRVHRRGTALHDVRCAVELRRVTPC